MSKKLFLILAAALLFIPAYSVMADSDGVISSYNSTIHVETDYNSLGIATGSTTTSTTIIATTDAAGKTTTSTTVTTTTSSYRNGSLKADSSATVSDTVDGSGNPTSHNEYTDTYTYDDNGSLVSASGSGTYTNKTYDADSSVTQTQSGTITRTFEVKDGQAVLTGTASSGTIKGDLYTDSEGHTLTKRVGDDGEVQYFYINGSGEEVSVDAADVTTTKDQDLGTSSNSTTFTNAYMGGSWVVTKQVSTSTSSMTGQSDQSITRTTTYTRDEHGTITGMTQTAEGTRTQTTSDGSQINYTLSDYKVTVSHDSQQGYYVSKETYAWAPQVTKEPSTSTPYDPWTSGTLEVVDGHLALIVNPDDVDSRSFYQMDPTTLTGETKKDKDGNYIIMLAVEDKSTKDELTSLVGHKVNLMWQYYTKSSAKDSSGYGWIWLAPTSDSRVNFHLSHDNESKVEQSGGNWDRSKQYVVID